MEAVRQWIDWHFWQFIAFAWVALCVLLIVMEIAPKAGALKASYDEWQQNEEKILEMDQWEEKSDQLALQTNLLQKQVKTLFISIPRNDQMSVILDCLHKSSEGIDLSLQQIKTDSPRPYGSHQEQPLKVVAKGGFHAVAAFLDRIERSPYLIKVEKLHIHRAGDLKAPLNAEIDLRAIVVER